MGQSELIRRSWSGCRVWFTWLAASLASLLAARPALPVDRAAPPEQHSPPAARPLTGKPWIDMDYGPFLSATIEAPFPRHNVACKGILICVDRRTDTHVLFDEDLLRYAAGWTGGRLNWTNVVFDGSHWSHPWIAGVQLFGNRVAPGWDRSGRLDDPRDPPYGPLPRDWARYRGLYVSGERVVLRYTVGSVDVLDSPAVERFGSTWAFSRTVQTEACSEPHWLRVVEGESDPTWFVRLEPAATATAPSVPRPGPSSSERPLAGSGVAAQAASAGHEVPALGRIVVFGRLPEPGEQPKGRPSGPVIPTDGLVAHWSFDRSEGVQAPSYDGHCVVHLSKATRVEGIHGQAVRFAHRKAVGTVETEQPLRFGGHDYTWAAWVRTTGGGTILSFTRSGKWVPGGKTLFIRGGRLAFDIGWVGVVQSSRLVADGRWHHVAVTHRARDGRVQLYVDGQPDGSRRLRSAPDPKGSRLRLGFTSNNFPELGSNRLTGELDEVLVFRRVLTADEIRVLCPEAVQWQRSVTAVAAVGSDLQDPPACWRLTEDRQLLLRLPASRRPRRWKLLIWRGLPERLGEFVELVRRSAEPLDLRSFTHGGPARWTPKLTTVPRLGRGDGPYVVDTLTWPDDNPWHSWLRFSGLDFFTSNPRRAAICTWNGDVWLVDGLGGPLSKLLWQRIATGLFQPLGLKIVDDQIYVCCRDQIVRLHDLNGDGEVDYYECFNGDHQVTEHFHEFAMDLQTDAAGNFYYCKAGRHALDAVVPQHGTLIRVSKDGSRSEILAHGFRAANGLGIGPNGEWVNTDQEGHWTPANRINLVRRGGFYGYNWSYHQGHGKHDRFDPPIVWLPKNVDRSPAEPLWVTSDRWGPLKGLLINTSYGTGQIFLVPYEVVDGVPQGAAVRFDLSFPTGIMRARFNPLDGQLYVCGLFGWSSDKTQPGGFFRVRYTGKPVDMPVQYHVARNGIRLTFVRPLDPRSAEDPSNYSLKQWNYRWRSQYGSDHYKVSDPNQTGFDRLTVRSVTLEPDGRTVFLEVPDLQPVMQLQISYRLKAFDGRPIQQDVYATINVLGPPYRPKGTPVVFRPSGRALAAPPQEALRPGLAVTFETREDEPLPTDQNRQVGKRVSVGPLAASGASDARDNGGSTHRDVRLSRVAALFVPRGQSPTPFLPPGPFHATLDGYWHVDLPGRYRLHVRGNGRAAVFVNGRRVWVGRGRLSTAPPVEVELSAGENRLRVEYDSPSDSDAVFRLYWASEAFAWEPLPPTSLFHDKRNDELAHAEQLRHGRLLFASRQCFRCHALPDGVSAEQLAMPETQLTPPQLANVGSRLQPRWLAAWLLQPHTVRNKVLMPSLLDPDAPDAAQTAADLVAYLQTLTGQAGPQGRSTQRPGRLPSGSAEQGQLLFENLGCLACHTFEPPDTPDPYQRVSLALVDAKFQPGQLTSFLLQPHRYYPGSRMPDLKLEPEQARSLAAFLRRQSRGNRPSLPADWPSGDAGRGRDAFQQLGCSQCHTVAEAQRLPPPNRSSVFGRSGGCLAPQPLPAAPDFGLSERERTALQTFLGTDGRSLTRAVPVEVAQRSVEFFNCTACHKRDDRTAVWPIVLALEGVQGTSPEYVPELTWVGEKLKPSWTELLLADRLAQKPRPWLTARMPVFAVPARELAVGLSHEHGFGTGGTTDEDAFRPTRPPDALRLGRQLTLNTQGFNCVQCHDVGQQPAVAPFENRGVNFVDVPARLRYDFYIRWMRDATRVELATRMPRLSPDGSQTEVKDVYDGDAQKQFDAIWHYIQSLGQEPKRKR